MDFVANDRTIAGPGTLESDWAAHGGLQALPLCTLATLLPPASRLVVVSPHPDDEVLGCGGLLAMAAACGRETRLVCITDGEASHPGSTQWPVERLRQRRRLEWTEGLHRLGVHDAEAVHLGLPDGALVSHGAALRMRLGSLLHASDVVVSTWQQDGHPDHEAAAHAVGAVCAEIGARQLQVPVWMWHWAVPLDARVPWSRLHRLPLTANALQRKRDAIRAHESQLAPREPGQGAVLSDQTLERLLREDEFFFLP